MKQCYLFWVLYILACTALQAQDDVLNRIVLIGDAGEVNQQQQLVIKNAALQILPGKTSVLFLGDNIYPRGMGLPGKDDTTLSAQILRSQYQPLRKAGAAVYFVPGNHDWDKSGSRGLAKIMQQSLFIQQQQDSLLQLLPANGCPDPVELPVSDWLTIIAYDSEWWLFPFNKQNITGDCNCKTRQDIMARFEELKYKNRHKFILLASHHPFVTYGPHGGYFTFKDHLFPLTNLSKNLYIPLPVIGSLYPLLRKAFTNPEDVRHPLYKQLRKSVETVFADLPNVLFAAGHEHSLQLIQQQYLQVVSGAGAKKTAVKKGAGSLYAAAHTGFVLADVLSSKQVRCSFFVVDGDSAVLQYTHTMPYQPVTMQQAVTAKPIAADSVLVSIKPAYDKKSKFHRWLFGQNYRREWAVPMQLPVIKLSSIAGGLKPLQLGGGMQSKSLRLADSTGKEWVIRSVEKIPDALLPASLQQTFAKDWLDDVTSAQHPFSALAVPPIANAVNVPHAKPIIGVLSPDTNLGVYNRIFSNLVVLLEEREPLGKSDNTEKWKANLQKDNDNNFDATAFLTARMLDAFTGDWDRHEDQWRWYYSSKGKNKYYTGVPRDRDQVFHVTQGLFPRLAAAGYLLPTLRNFDDHITKVEWLLYKTRFVNAYPAFQLSRQQWATQSAAFTAAVTDDVLEQALRRLPAVAYNMRSRQLLHTLQMRRQNLPAAMDRYYCFIQKIADIQLSDKNELVYITDSAGAVQVTISKIDKSGAVKEQLMNKTYEASLTKQIRIYLGDGADSVVLNNRAANIGIRLIGGNGAKSFNVQASAHKVPLYDKPGGSFTGIDVNRLVKKISQDSAHTAFVPVNLYNTWMPLLLAGINADDGLIMGAGFKYTRQEGFRKQPFASMHQLLIGHSFSTSAYQARYSSEWTDVWGKTDLLLQAVVKAPNNTINFFGRGNQTAFDKTGDFLRYYRTRFSTYRLDPAVRWQGNKAGTLSVGPSLYYYRFDADDNIGRLISYPSLIGSYDSATVQQNKLHVGFSSHYISDRRNSKIIPQWGSYISIVLQAYKGLGKYAKNYAQLIPEIALYKSLNKKATIILAERLGGTVSFGKTTFYQSAFIGGHENLLGYRQYRFAGNHSFYNNLELRIKLADVANYILPGQLGITGFWDVGRVWQEAGEAGTWHHGFGGGIYFSPASMVAFNFVMGRSGEGWYPYFTMGFRF